MSPCVESKNWSMVRAYVGWRRYDTEEGLRVLERLLRAITIRHNFFMPSMRLVKREREGRKVIKQYEMDTPLQRVLRLSEVKATTKERLVQLRNSIDIVKLSEEIENFSEELNSAYEGKLKSDFKEI